MTTFARFWVILVTSHMVAYGLLAVIVRRTIDLRPEILLQHAVIPFLQAAVLAWLVGAVGLRSTVREAGIAIRLPLVAGLWCSAAVLLTGYWWPAWAPDLTRVLLLLASLAAMAAAILLVTFSMTIARSSFWKVAPFALVLALLASNGLGPWLGALPTWLPSDWPLLLRQAVLLWTLLLILLALTAAAESAVRSRNRTSAFFVSAIHPLAIIAAGAVSLNWSVYSYPMEPWFHVFVTCVFIGAAAALTAALVLRADPPAAPCGASESAVGRQREIGLIGVWMVLTLTAVAGMACLHALVQGQWNWGATTWLSLVLPPLVQAAWLRFSREIRALPATVRELATNRPYLVVLVLVEPAVIVVLCGSVGMGEVEAGMFRFSLAAYAALRVAALGAAVVVVFRRHDLGTTTIGVLATLTGAVGIGTAGSGASALLPVAGLLLVRVALARMSHQFPTASGRQPVAARFHVAAADALLAPALVLVAGSLLSLSEPLTVAAPVALSLVVVATSAAAISLRSGAVVSS